MITKENSNEFSQLEQLGINEAVRRLCILIFGLKKYKLTTKEIKIIYSFYRTVCN